MVGAVVAGEGLERVAEIASRHAGAPVAVVVPRVGVPPEWARYERYVGSRLAGGKPDRPPDVTAEVAISSGGQDVGAVLMLGPGKDDAGEYLHVAAIAALTEVAVAEARDETEQSLRGSFLEELLRRDDLLAEDVVRRGRRLGCDLAAGAVALCAEPHEGTPGRIVASIVSERPDALAQAIDGRVYALVPDSVEEARKLATRLGRRATVGISSRYTDATGLRRALEEAELVLKVSATGAVPEGGVGESTYRLLFHVLASRPEEIESFYDDTVASLVGLRRAVLDRPDRDARGLPGPQLQHEPDRDRDPRPPPHGELPPGSDPRADGARSQPVRGPRTARPGAEGLPHHQAAPAPLGERRFGVLSPGHEAHG